jgi:RNA polymerase sigma-70 factor, ECF subfamily
MDDLEFVQRCVKGEAKAWDEFVDKYSSLIYHYIHSVLKVKGAAFSQETINDIFQEILLSLIKDNSRKLGSFKARNKCSLATWLRQVTVNSTIDHIRKIRPTISIDEEIDDGFSIMDILPSDSPSAIDAISQEEKTDNLEDCIEKLSLEDKYFLELHMHRGLSLEDLKVFFKISRAAIDMRKSRIVERLKECFKSKGFVLPGL